MEVKRLASQLEGLSSSPGAGSWNFHIKMYNVKSEYPLVSLFTVRDVLDYYKSLSELNSFNKIICWYVCKGVRAIMGSGRKTMIPSFTNN